MRITQEQIKAMLPGQVLTVKCADASEWESSKRIAQKVKKGHQRGDGNSYIVSQNVRELTVTVETTDMTKNSGSHD